MFSLAALGKKKAGHIARLSELFCFFLVLSGTRKIAFVQRLVPCGTIGSESRIRIFLVIPVIDHVVVDEGRCAQHEDDAYCCNEFFE